MLACGKARVALNNTRRLITDRAASVVTLKVSTFVTAALLEVGLSKVLLHELQGQLTAITMYLVIGRSCHTTVGG